MFSEETRNVLNYSIYNNNNFIDVTCYDLK